MEDKDTFQDSFTERYRHCDFLYAKDDQYKVVELDFEINGPPHLSINILTSEYKKLKLENNMKIPYNGKPCKIYLKTVFPNFIKGHHLKRNVDLQIMSIGFSDMVLKVFASLMNLTNKKKIS